MEYNYLLGLNINPLWEDMVGLFLSSMPLKLEHGYHFIPLDSKNVQKRRYVLWSAVSGP